MKLSESQAHYIRAVYELSGESGGARGCDIAERLRLSKASVSLAVTKLAKRGAVYRDAEKRVCLTRQGEREAVRIVGKSRVLRRFLTQVLGVDGETAERDACAMGHVISEDALCAVCRFTCKRESGTRCTERCPAAPEGRTCCGKPRSGIFTPGKRP